MKFNGKKFSEIILEQEVDTGWTFDGEPVKATKVIDPKTGEVEYQLPEVKVVKKVNNYIMFDLNGSDVTNVRVA